MTDEKRTVMENVARMLEQKNPEEKAFILGYIVALEKHESIRQQVVTA